MKHRTCSVESMKADLSALGGSMKTDLSALGSMNRTWPASKADEPSKARWTDLSALEGPMKAPKAR